MDSNMGFYLRNSILCVGFLVGMGLGVFLIIRRHTLVGILTLIGFALFALEPLADFVIFRVLYAMEFQEETYIALDWSYVCLSTIAILLGSIALVIALFKATREKHGSSSTLPIEPGTDS